MWKRNDYFLSNAYRLPAEELAALLYDRVCRCDFCVPGFALLDFASSVNSRSQRAMMVRLKEHLNRLHQQRHGKKLAYASMSRFDQQVTTKPHRDGGPHESLLMLGYEPTAVKSRVAISDSSKCAFDMGITPTELLESHNPMYSDGRQMLARYTTSLDAFDNTAFQILLLNNSVLPHGTGERNWLGVLHTAEIVNPMADRSRVVNSTMIASVDGSAEEDVSETEQQEFTVTDLVRREVYG